MIQCTAKSKQSGERCKRPVSPGRQVCYYHGGATPRGFALPQTKTGKRSKDLPTRLLANYEQSLDDPELLELKDDLSLVETRLRDLLKRVDTGESGQAWRLAENAYRGMEKGLADGNDEAYAASYQQLGELIKRGLSDYKAWDEINKLLDLRRKFVESERKRLVELQQVITSERALLLFGASTEEFRQCVLAHCDNELAGRVLQDMNVRLDRLRYRYSSPTMMIEG